jgi:hypothetical protein
MQTTYAPLHQDGANAAFHEAVGDSVTYGMYPNPSIRTLLKTALAKLPQVSFGLIVDLWRWKVFENDEYAIHWNELWWRLNLEYLGVTPPKGYESEGLDALGKCKCGVMRCIMFHFPANQGARK